MASNRIDRISELVGRSLAETIRQVKDPRVRDALISVTHCEVTGDLRYAKCYISVLGSAEQQKEVMRGLKSASGWLRREVGRAVQLRYAPELVLVLDESIVRGAHINEVVNRLEREGKMGSAETDAVEEEEE